MSTKGLPPNVTVTAATKGGPAPPPAHCHRPSTNANNHKVFIILIYFHLYFTFYILLIFQQSNAANDRAGIQRVFGGLPTVGSSRSASLPGGATLTPGGFNHKHQVCLFKKK